ncbi:MAG: hypothetical protein ACOYL6_08525 [Bacteriovoracaceae bacterium]
MYELFFTLLTIIFLSTNAFAKSSTCGGEVREGIAAAIEYGRTKEANASGATDKENVKITKKELDEAVNKILNVCQDME